MLTVASSNSSVDRVQRHHAGVDDLKHRPVVEVHDRLHALDRSRVEVDRGILAKVHLRLDDPARFLRQAERSRRERRDEDIGELVGRRDAAQRQRVEECRIFEGEREVDTSVIVSPSCPSLFGISCGGENVPCTRSTTDL